MWMGFLKTVVERELSYLVTFTSKKANESLCSCLRINVTDGEMLLRFW